MDLTNFTGNFFKLWVVISAALKEFDDLKKEYLTTREKVYSVCLN